ncbi:MAG: YlbF family regulator [Bacilli bacterium]|nr:YlbF family regulator [Bacilli bacterium]
MEKLDRVINYIMNSPEYQDCIKLKKQMSSNKDLIELIDKVKDLQKKYIKSNRDESIKKELDSSVKLLEEIPIYNIYMSKLDIVNRDIDYVKDELNEYFYNITNNGK